MPKAKSKSKAQAQPTPRPKRFSEVFTSSSSDKHANSQRDREQDAQKGYESEGPSLPILGVGNGGGGGPGLGVGDSTEGEAREEGAKSATTNKNPESERQGEKRESARNLNSKPLYTPWIFLPSGVRQAVEKRHGKQWSWEDNVTPMVVGRNSKPKAEINKFKTYLRRRDRGTGSAEGKSEEMLVLAAYADAANKLVGVVEIGRRVLSGNNVADGRNGSEQTKEKDEDGDMQTTWYMYTILSSREFEVQHRNNKMGERGSKTESRRDHDDEEEEGAEEDAFEPMDVDIDGDIDDAQKEKNHIKIQKVPVLMVWFSRRRIQEFREGFGEVEFTLPRAEEEVETGREES